MERAILLISLFVSVMADMNNRYYYISDAMTWNEAQAYCRKHYTDLAFIERSEDKSALEQAKGAEKTFKAAWIGLYPDPDNQDNFKWSGGGNVTFSNWAEIPPPTTGTTQTKGQLTQNGKWILQQDTEKAGFYCVNPVIVEELKSWEEALEHCRARDADLASRHVVNTLLDASVSVLGETERVWVGLRFLRDRWLWVKGKEWSEAGEDLQCPLWKRCAALTKDQQLETIDCKERLPFMCKWRDN